MKTNTTEKGLETLIMRYLTGVDGLSPSVADRVAELSPLASGSGWIAGYAGSYD
jgi:type I restriction enzyme R subunit